ncbi:MAG: radical SAM protein, partial [Bdellovibrionia bacterium]
PAGNEGAHVKQEMSPEDVEKLCAASKERISYLILTGGEPFVRDDLDRIVIPFHRKLGTRFLTIVSNGSFPQRTHDVLEKILISCPGLRVNIAFTVSDIGPLHDRTRGLPGSYEKMVESRQKIQRLRELFPNLFFTIATQLGDDNVQRSAAIIERVKTEFSPDEHFVTLLRDAPKRITPVSNAVTYLPQLVASVAGAYPSGKNLFQAFYNQIVQKSILEMGRIRQGQADYRPCAAGRKFATLYENGNLFPCENRQDLKLGNVRQAGFDLGSLLKSANGRKACDAQLKERCRCDWGPAISQNLMADPRFLAGCLWGAMSRL